MTAHLSLNNRVLPVPDRVREDADDPFELRPETPILISGDSEWIRRTASLLQKKLRKMTGEDLEVDETDPDQHETPIVLQPAEEPETFSSGAYHLQITPQQITIHAGDHAGCLHGVQSLLQLMPAEVHRQGTEQGQPGPIPAATIRDAPDYEWRGMHLDVSRHFFDVDWVKQYIDLLSFHKLNRFHWHLTDDVGWRIEIDGYPGLTEVGAWRGTDEELPPAYHTGDERYGGYYTRDDVREVVSFARERGVTVVPEIDVPGHVRPACVAYPELLCSCEVEPFQSGQGWSGNLLCAGQEATYEFVEDVFAEVSELFPGPYLHAGGDERPEGVWSECPDCRAAMEEHNLSDEDQLQNRFFRRAAEIAEGLGKRLIGWNDVLAKGELDREQTMIMSWHEPETGADAVRDGYDTIFAPYTNTYLDLYQDEDPREPGLSWSGPLSMETVHEIELPSVEESKREHVVGIHGCLWSETLVDEERAEYMAFPRMAALADACWNEEGQRNREAFEKKLPAYFAYLEARDISYRLPPPKVERSDGEVVVEKPYPWVTVRYTTDGTEPDASSSAYDEPVPVPEDGVVLARSFIGDRRSRVVSDQQLMKLGRWEVSSEREERHRLEWEAGDALSGVGTYEVIFLRGEDAPLYLEEVTLLEGSNELARDEHEGVASWPSIRQVYRLDVEEYTDEETYTIRAEVRTEPHRRGEVSTGTVFVQRMG